MSMSMKNTKWITKKQHKILSKYDKVWADMLQKGIMHKLNENRAIDDLSMCIVGTLRLGSEYHKACQDCYGYSIALNDNFQGREYKQFGAKQFRKNLGEFLKHFESEHKDAIARVRKNAE